MSLENNPLEEFQKQEEATDWLSPLKYEHIEKKIKINLEQYNITMEEFKMRLQIELHELQRTKIRILIQEQNYNEQIAYLDHKIRASQAIGLVKRINGELEK